jgi:hypothetical protein
MKFDIKEGSPVVTIKGTAIEALFIWEEIRPEKYVEGAQLQVLLSAIRTVQDFLSELDDENKVEYE